MLTMLVKSLVTLAMIYPKDELQQFGMNEK